MINDEIDRLEEEFKKLRVLYEKYFAGVDKLEPQKERDAWRKRLRELMTQRTANTAKRFRLQGLQATLITHEQYWNRIARQIEEGTFKRDRLRAAKILAEAPPIAEPESAAPPASAYPGGTRKSDDALKTLHAEYLAARKSLGQGDINIESLAQTVAKQTAAIKERYKCEAVEFKVAVKDGKVILKASPK